MRIIFEITEGQVVGTTQLLFECGLYQVLHTQGIIVFEGMNEFKSEVKNLIHFITIERDLKV